MQVLAPTLVSIEVVPESLQLEVNGSAQLAVRDLMAITEANYRCNELGLDTISCGNTIGCAMELSETGALPEKIAWGDAGRLNQLVEDIAYQRGLGAELAQGSKRLSEKYQRPALSMQVKGMELPAYDPRGCFGQGLEYAVNNRGGCHIRGSVMYLEATGNVGIGTVSPSSTVGLAAGSGSPARAATVISRISLVNSLPRLASWAFFRCCMLAHLLCPAMFATSCNSIRAFYHCPRSVL